jgi:hypothetical protein
LLRAHGPGFFDNDQPAATGVQKLSQIPPPRLIRINRRQARSVQEMKLRRTGREREMTHACRWKGFALAVVLTGVTTVPTGAQSLFDNWNTEACGVTDVATLTIARAVRLQRVDIWYRWRANEATVGYTVSRGNGILASGELARTECDPYQANWCVARVELSADVDPGTYTFQTERAGICQNAGSGGQGFIRAYGAGE